MKSDAAAASVGGRGDKSKLELLVEGGILMLIPPRKLVKEALIRIYRRLPPISRSRGPLGILKINRNT